MTTWVVLVLSVSALLQTAFSQDLCADALFQDEIGYRYHPNECARYIQCNRNPDTNTIIAMFRPCPHALFWNQASRSCLPHATVNCILDACTSPSDNSHKKMYGSGCRAYWRCDNGVKSAACCDPGMRYIEGVGCSADYTCTDPCPGPCAENDVCRSRPNYGRNDRYLHVDGNGILYNRNCPQNTHYDHLECGCVNSVFNGCSPDYQVSDFNSYLAARGTWLTTQLTYSQPDGFQFTFGSQFTANFNLGQASPKRPIVVRFAFRQQFIAAGITRLRMLSSTDCSKCNQFNVDLFATNVEATMMRFGNVQARTSVSVQGAEGTALKNVMVVYDGKELMIAVRTEHLTYMNRVKAPKLKIMDCGASFGSSNQFPLYGDLQSIYFYTCLPSGRLVDMLN